MQVTSSTQPVVLYQPQIHNKFAHFVHLMIIFGAVISFGTIAVYEAFGFKINWNTKTIQQTGLIALNSSSVGGGAQVRLNDDLGATYLPYRFNQLLPGQYSVGVKKSGYQDWSHDVTVVANRAVTFSSIVLVFTHPLPSLVPNGTVEVVPTPTDTSTGVEIRAGNELWLHGIFITRTSQDLVHAQWFPDAQHIVYQAGATLWLSDLDGLNTQKILNFPSTMYVPVTFQQRGQVMLYQFANGNTWRLVLY